MCTNQLDFSKLRVGDLFYTATGRWQVIKILPETRWIAKMVWKRDGTEISDRLQNGIAFDRYDIGGCHLTDRFRS